MSCKNCYHDNLLGRWGFSGLTVSSFTLEVWRPQSLYAWDDRGESRQRNKTGRERKVGGGVHEKVSRLTSYIPTFFRLSQCSLSSIF